MPSHGLKKLVLEHDRLLVWLMITLFVITLSTACLWKYAMFLYNGLDLAIIHQTFWNSLHGRLFQQSIHPHSYLGDHAELIILPLLPLYAIFPDPRTLLVLQAIALALPAWPLFLIAKNRFAKLKNGYGPLLPFLIAAFWLLNPSVQNIALYEFHLLPFAIFPLCMAALAYEKNNWRPFILWLLIALLVREDVSLVVFCFGLLAWAEKKSRRWIIPPLALGAAWFVWSSDLIASFAPGGSYKFLVYYAWLGNSFGGILLGLIAHPLAVLRHLFRLGNLDMILGLLMPVAFLPLLAPLALILLLGPLTQILLGAPGGNELIVQTHYASLFLPALFLGLMASLAKLFARKRLGVFSQKEIAFGLPALLLAAVVYSSLMLGPLPSLVTRIISGTDEPEARAAAELVTHIPSDTAVAAGFRLLPQLSSRERLYSLHYIFLGVTQFAEEKYPAPENIAYAALDSHDLLDYRAQAFRTAWSAPHYRGGRERLAQLAGSEISADGPFSLFRCGLNDAPQITETEPAYDPAELALRGFAANARYVADRKTLELDFSWRPEGGGGELIAQKYSVSLALLDGTGVSVYDTQFPLDEPMDKITDAAAGFRRVVSLPLPTLKPGYYFPWISLEEQDATMFLNGVRSDEREVQRRSPAARHILPVIVVD